MHPLYRRKNKDLHSPLSCSNAQQMLLKYTYTYYDYPPAMSRMVVANTYPRSTLNSQLDPLPKPEMVLFYRLHDLVG